MPGNTFVTPVSLAIAWLVVWIACGLAGRVQRRMVGASHRRLWGTAAIVAAGGVAPLLPAFLLGECLDVSWSEGTNVETGERVPGGTVHFGIGYLGAPLPVNLLITAFWTVISVTTAIRLMRPLHRMIGLSAEMPRLEDAAITGRIAEIAQAMRTTTPIAFRLGSTSESLELQGATAGVLAPVMFVTDGVIDRLSAARRDAVIAHEIAHVAQGAFRRRWLLAFLLVTVAAASSAVLPPALALTLGAAVVGMVNRILSYFDERDADRRAAEVIGFEAMARALDDVHAPRDLPCGPRLRRFVLAMQSHPAIAVRGWHLARHALAENVEFDAVEAAAQRRWSHGLVATASVILACCLLLGVTGHYWVAIVPLLIVFAPPLTLTAAHLPVMRYYWQLGLLDHVRNKAIVLILGIACLPVIMTALSFDTLWPALVGLTAILWLVIVAVRSRRWATRIDTALRNGGPAAALEVIEKLPRRAKRRRAIRLMHALHLVATGDESAGREELDLLIAAKPRYWSARLWRCAASIHDDPVAAARLAEPLLAALPNNPFVLNLVARIESRRGQADAARRTIDRAIELLPTEARFHGTRVQIALDAGNLDEAERLIAVAGERDPGSTRRLLLVAELAIRRGDPNADAALAGARRAVEDNPMSLVQGELRRLEAMSA